MVFPSYIFFLVPPPYVVVHWNRVPHRQFIFRPSRCWSEMLHHKSMPFLVRLHVSAVHSHVPHKRSKQIIHSMYLCLMRAQNTQRQPKPNTRLEISIEPPQNVAFDIHDLADRTVGRCCANFQLNIINRFHFGQRASERAYEPQTCTKRH